MRELLLTIHGLAAAIWLGAGLYDVLLMREVHVARGATAERDLPKIRFRYGNVIAAACSVLSRSPKSPP